MLLRGYANPGVVLSGTLIILLISAAMSFAQSEDQAKSELVERRDDVQVGASGNAAGSTSLVSQPTSPKLFGLSFESFGAQKTVDGSTITFHVNPVNLFCATKNGADVVITSALVKGREID